ncbi:MAG: hypothetical protein ABIE43_00325 [Patescibacteria group bacterium]
MVKENNNDNKKLSGGELKRSRKIVLDYIGEKERKKEEEVIPFIPQAENDIRLDKEDTGKPYISDAEREKSLASLAFLSDKEKKGKDEPVKEQKKSEEKTKEFNNQMRSINYLKENEEIQRKEIIEKEEKEEVDAIAKEQEIIKKSEVKKVEKNIKNKKKIIKKKLNKEIKRNKSIRKVNKKNILKIFKIFIYITCVLFILYLILYLC